MEIKNIVLLVIFILGLVYLQMLQAKPVDEIINRYVAARGGKEKLNLINSLYMEGSRKIMGTEMAIKVIKVQGRLFRNDFEFAGSKGYTIVTATAGWSFIPMRSQTIESINGDRLMAMQTELDITEPLINHIAKGHKAVLAGKEDVDGREAYKINLTLNTGKQIIYLIDRETSLVLRTKQMRPSLELNQNETAEPEKELTTNYSDYKSVDGILFPHKISNPGNGPGNGTTVFNKIEWNKPIDESLYQPFV